ncbi:MAG TPA: permease-like cell division protein FtsX [Bacteroidales bacterium]|nr:permease-like cell division protein FtsX [Bacteroidales bacterium]
MPVTKRQNKLIQQRIISSYSSTLISVALVLFILSLVGLIVLNEHKISNHIKEKVGFTIFLKQDVKEADLQGLRKRLDAMEMVKSTEYVSAEEASKRLAVTLGKDYIDLAQGNPVPPSIEVRLFAEYATAENFVKIEQQMQGNEYVDTIHYDRLHIQTLNLNLKRISFFLLGLGLLLFGISIVLIHNTIRLSVYSKRFIINTMQLVGATNAYIRQPFILRGAFQGFVSALIAIALLSGFLFFLQKEIKDFIKYLDFELLGILFLSIILIGIALSTIATYFAVNRFLNIHKDDLYI